MRNVYYVYSPMCTVRCVQGTKFSGLLLERFGSQSNCLAFYKRFLESPNFASWFERRRQAAMLWQVCECASSTRRPARRAGRDGDIRMRLILNRSTWSAALLCFSCQLTSQT